MNYKYIKNIFASPLPIITYGYLFLFYKMFTKIKHFLVYVSFKRLKQCSWLWIKLWINASLLISDPKHFKSSSSGCLQYYFSLFCVLESSQVIFLFINNYFKMISCIISQTCEFIHSVVFLKKIYFFHLELNWFFFSLKQFVKKLFLK